MSQSRPRILLVGNYPADAQYSMLGFSRWLSQRMPAEGFDIQLIQPRRVVGAATNPHAGLGKYRSYVDKLILFPRELRKAAPRHDFVHITDHGNAHYGKQCGKNWGVTVHDLLPIRASLGEIPGWTISGSGQKLQAWIKESLAGAPTVACVSEATRQDFLRLVAQPGQTVERVYNGIYHPLTRVSSDEAARRLQAAGQPELAKRPFILHVGGNQPYKNRIGYLRIAHKLHQRPEFQNHLFIAAGKPFTAEMREYVAANQLESVVKSLVGLDDGAIEALYSSAEALIFPSTYEGFGLPLLEAMQCGCPVFTSNVAPMTEIGGDAVQYFDPHNIDTAVERISSDWPNRGSNIEAGFSQVEKFSSDLMAKGYATWYRNHLGLATP